ncbi:MAG TPA: hypothetical protein VL172_00965 [Kofleriaceae bacterium]|nr:hypothetical protein [Kofleriaceae bacterium]
MGDEREILERATPDAVRQVCRTLRGAGHQAWAVGGAVRDALLHRDAPDWDVATSAEPAEVQALFRRTIPTGIQHGTVTVLVGKGEGREAIEVTTFRGEGAYSDARRPDSVRFGVPLDEDLARRDLLVNAMAWDPIDGVLHDPFGGLDDLRARRLRAVGDPAERFREDGLRVMRAVRFAAQLGFALDAATEAAIPLALGSLRKVSVERIRDELYKLLAAPAPAAGLAIAERTGILGAIWDGWPIGYDFAAGAGRAESARGLLGRLAALLRELGPEAAEALMRHLKASNDDRERVVRMVRYAPAWQGVTTDGQLRRLLAAIGRAHVAEVIEHWGDPALAARAQAILSRGDPLASGELAIKGGDVMRVRGIGPGREVGELIAALLERVLDDPALNTRERLLELVAETRHK